MKRFFTRIIGLFLVFIMSISFVTVSANTETTQGGIDPKLSEAIEVLRLFSIIPNYYDYNIIEDELISRADFVMGVAKMLNLTKYEGNTFYYDVPENHYAFNEISALTNADILSGTGNKLFRPDDKMTKADGYKIITTILGYGDWALYNGGYPTGYIAAANRAKISDGVSSDGYMNTGDMMRIFYNAITTLMLEPVVFGTDDITYSTENNETILSLYRDVYYSEGRVKGADCVSFNGTTLLEGQVMIDKAVYECNVEAGAYLGEKVKFFYHKPYRSDEKTILWIKPIYDRDAINITVDNDASFNKDTYEFEYVVNDRERKLTLDRGIVLFYNGGIISKGISEILNKPEYEMKLVKDEHGKYIVAVVRSYENYVVGSIDSVEYMIYDKENTGKEPVSLNPNDYERIKISVLGKTAIGFQDIKENDVLSVYQSADKKYIEVHVSHDVATGVIDAIKNKKYGKIIVIDAIEYFVPETIKGTDVKVGQSAKLYLDVKGEVALIETETSSYTPAYLIAMAESNNFFDSALMFRVLTKQGELKEIPCDNNIKIDGKVYKDLSKVKKYITPDGKFTPQLAMLKVSGQGKIKMIDTTMDNPDTEDDDVLEVNMQNRAKVKYRNSQLGIGSVIDSNTIIFALPDDLEKAEDEEFEVLTSLENDRWYTNVVTYKVQDRVGYEQFIVLHGANNPPDNPGTALPILIKEFSQIYGEDGEIHEAIIGYQGVSEREFMLSKGVSIQSLDVSEGDVVRFMIRPDGTVAELFNNTKIYDYDDSAGYIKMTADTSFGNYLNTYVGYAIDLVDGVLKIGLEKSDKIEGAVNTKNVPCLVYDKEHGLNDVFVGNVEDIKTYYTVGEDCSTVIVAESYGAPKLIIVYR